MLRPLLIVLFAIAAGCGSATVDPEKSNTQTARGENDEEHTSRTSELTERDLEVVEFVLRRNPTKSNGRIYFLTTTPMEEWSDDGGWESLPDSFHEQIEDLPANYRPASEATLREHSVFEKSTDNEAWIEWVTIKKWISDTEVEVEQGVWCCPLGGGAGTDIYEKVDGEWRFKESVSGWVS